MAQSLSKLYVHLIFHIKDETCKIQKKDRSALYAYMGSIIKDSESIPVLINGTADHVHAFCIMSKNISLAKLVENIKRHSSRWIKTLDESYRNFSWQGGYAGFSVSPSVQEKRKRYIANQEEHHKEFSFRQEYLMFLKEYGIEYNEKYLWS